MDRRREEGKRGEGKGGEGREKWERQGDGGREGRGEKGGDSAHIMNSWLRLCWLMMVYRSSIC